MLRTMQDFNIFDRSCSASAAAGRSEDPEEKAFGGNTGTGQEEEMNLKDVTGQQGKDGQDSKMFELLRRQQEKAASAIVQTNHALLTVDAKTMEV